MPSKRQASPGAAALSYAVAPPAEPTAVAAAVERAMRLGFSSLMALGANSADPAADRPDRRALLAALAHAKPDGLPLIVCLRLDRIVSSHPLVHEKAPDAFRSAASAGVIDPRRPFEDVEGLSMLALPDDNDLLAWWVAHMESLRAQGADRFAALTPTKASAVLFSRLRDRGQPIDAFAPAQGEPTPSRLPVLLDQPRAREPLNREAKRALLAAAATASPGWMMVAGFETGVEAEVQALNRRIAARGDAAPMTRALSGSGAPVEIAIGGGASDPLLFARNRTAAPIAWPPAGLDLDSVGALAPVEAFALADGMLGPGETALFAARPRPAVKWRLTETAKAAANPALRVVIANIAPSVDGGAFAVKRTLGEPLAITANIFADGHTKLAAELLTKAEDEANWSRTPLRAEPNDVWTGEATFARMGRHAFTIEAWVDVWGGFVEDFEKKVAAGVDVALERREAQALIEAARTRAKGGAAKALGTALSALKKAKPETANEIVGSHELAIAMAKADERPFLTRSFVQPVVAERIAARFSSWYELFPRSQSPVPGQHGTFADVIAKLPRIAGMGFDTVYLPPIHPIGETNRKGKNNSLTPEPDDVGSPYAIGSALGGHEAVHPDLGTLEDFRDMVDAANAIGLEVAIDFAIQCAPDHPWVRQHPEWFDWRPDGTIKYAENPPKKYQDIVNVDFYKPGAIPSLWEALRDVVLFWAAQGVRTFRVDNPHTKPLPFWRWMIAEVQARYPDALFLSEAFTRPQPMTQLAKAGFSQSYSYFTWRNAKWELEEYFTELNQAPARDVLRPHLFVNTPDINPVFLQTSGRGGFLIRAALAATLSGLFGVYSGFEFCEAAALPGREEYLDSEKYQIRQRPDRAPGDIVDEIAQLNAIRRAEPALQTHLGTAFHNAFNDQVLYFSKTAPGQGGLVLVAVSLDPHRSQEADFEVPLWLFGLPDHESVDVTDLLTYRRFRWTGKVQHLRLTPDEPYALWRIAPTTET